MLRQLFQQEYTKIEKSLFLVAMGYLHNQENAKDAVQEAALAAYRNFASLENKAYFKTWLTRIVINKCKDFLKKQKYREELTDLTDLTAQTGPIGGMDRNGAFGTLPTADMELMDALLRLHREVALYITLRFYHDMTYEEVGRLLEQPVSTVKYRTKNAMIQLKNLLEGDV